METGDAATGSVGGSSGQWRPPSIRQSKRQGDGATKEPSSGPMTRSSTSTRHRRTDPRILHMQRRQPTDRENRGNTITSTSTLAGKRALVTGGSRGIGAAIARRIAANAISFVAVGFERYIVLAVKDARVSMEDGRYEMRRMSSSPRRPSIRQLTASTSMRCRPSIRAWRTSCAV